MCYKRFKMIIEVCLLLQLSITITTVADGMCHIDSIDNCPNDNKNVWEVSEQKQDSDEGCFRAAVFENNRVDVEDDFGKAIEINLSNYNKVAKLAAENGAKIIVFPEDGIIHGNKNKMQPHLQEIPDPIELSKEQNNPCLHPDVFVSSNILRKLSCIARENRLYVVANFGTKQTCKPGEKVGERICPEIGYFSLNTDVVLDPTGVFLKRYRKYNMFIEIFDRAPSLEITYFDTPFGRFGVFTCFDIVFRHPAIDLVEKYEIDTILFPTWWYDEIPMLTAIQSQDAWSYTNRVNILAANMFRPELASVGSGIYTGNNTINTNSKSKVAKLIIANVAKRPRSEKLCEKDFNPTVIEIDTGFPVKDYKASSYKLKESDTVFVLQKPEERRTVCSGQVCCTVDYKINEPFSSDLLNRLIIVVRDSRRKGHFEFYEQVCLLATIEFPFSKENLAETVFSKEGLVGFSKLDMKGTFESKHIFPVAAHDVSNLVNREDREFECGHFVNKTLFRCKHIYKDPASDKNVSSFGMYGRIYEKDKMPDGW